MKAGIFCLTRDNLRAEWIHFEAGAVSKTKDARAYTILFDGLKPADIAPPLGQFQHTEFNESQMLALMKSLNKRLPEVGLEALADDVLHDQFSLYWPSLQKDVAAVTTTAAASTPNRSLDEKVDEILSIVRESHTERMRMKQALNRAMDKQKASAKDSERQKVLKWFNAQIAEGPKTRIEDPSSDTSTDAP